MKTTKHKTTKQHALWQDSETEHISRFKEGTNYKPMKRKTTKIKARIVGIPIQNYPWASSHEWTIPATAEAYDAMVEQMAVETTHSEIAEAALAAIGITRPTP